MTEQKTSPNTPEDGTPKPGFLSIRWRLMTPVFFIVLMVAMVGAYFVARDLSGGVSSYQENMLLQSSRTVTNRTAQLYDYHRQEAQRVAFTIGVPEAIRDERPQTLEPILESLARINDLDSIIVTDAEGREILGVQRVATADGVDFALSTVTDLSQQPIVRAVIDEAYIGATAYLRTPGGIMLYTAVPVNYGDQFIGLALVGQNLDAVLADLRGSAVSDVVLYGADGRLLQTTFPASENRDALGLADEIFNQAVLAVQQIPIQTMRIDGQAYQGAYQPFNFGPNTLGVVGVLMPDHVPYTTQVGRQLTAIFASVLAGAVVIVAYVSANRLALRAEKVTAVAQQLASGEAGARTQMQARDEIQAMGQALDTYADFVQVQEDKMRRKLWRQRREISHMNMVFEALPEGVVVQDMEGRVLMMNDYARHLLGSQRVFRSTGLHELAAAVGDHLGVALMPGLYALGDPHRINLDDRVLSAQAAAVTTNAERRIGTVVVLRDISEEILREQERDRLLDQVAKEVQVPLREFGRVAASSDSGMVQAFARAMSRQSVTLQKMIVEMRELTNVDAVSVQHRQRALSLETLIWSVANEWRQVAAASGLNLHVIIEEKGLFVLGDEKRLRWAIGNIVDNAVKYTPAGGAFTLEIRAESDGIANLRVRDNGVGIARPERPYLFTRFFRGTPVNAEGEIIRVPGMGQGLYITRQVFEAHGGTVKIKSSQGVGTAVYMTLPLTSPVGYLLPQLTADMEGETVRLPENILIDRD